MINLEVKIFGTLWIFFLLKIINKSIESGRRFTPFVIYYQVIRIKLSAFALNL